MSDEPKPTPRPVIRRAFSRLKPPEAKPSKPKKNLLTCRNEADFVKAVSLCVDAVNKQQPLQQIIVTGKVHKTLRWTMPICEFIHNQHIAESTALIWLALSLPLGQLCSMLAQIGYSVRLNSERRLVILPPAKSKETDT